VENIRFPHSPTPSHSPWKTRDRLIGSHRHDEFPTFPQAPLLQYSIIDDFFMLLFIAPLEQLHKELYTPGLGNPFIQMPIVIPIGLLHEITKFFSFCVTLNIPVT